MTDASEMKNLKSRKLYLQVYDEIKNYIEENHLLPGDKLPSEMKMCEMLGVSRNVLREAIKSLEITGTVSSTPGAGRSRSTPYRGAKYGGFIFSNQKIP